MPPARQRTRIPRLVEDCPTPCGGSATPNSHGTARATLTEWPDRRETASPSSGVALSGKRRSPGRHHTVRQAPRHVRFLWKGRRSSSTYGKSCELAPFVRPFECQVMCMFSFACPCRKEQGTSTSFATARGKGDPLARRHMPSDDVMCKDRSDGCALP